MGNARHLARSLSWEGGSGRVRADAADARLPAQLPRTYAAGSPPANRHGAGRCIFRARAALFPRPPPPTQSKERAWRAPVRPRRAGSRPAVPPARAGGGGLRDGAGRVVPALRPAAGERGGAHGEVHRGRRRRRRGVRGRQRVPRPQGGAHRQRVNPRRGDRDRGLPRPAPPEPPGDQHRPDDRLGRRVARGRRGVHAPGALLWGESPGWSELATSRSSAACSACSS